VLESAAVSYGKATPYFPVVDLLKHYVHVEDGDDTRTIRAKVTGHIITLGEVLQETLPALLALVDTLPEDSPFLQLDPRQRRQRTLDALTRHLSCVDRNFKRPFSPTQAVPPSALHRPLALRVEGGGRAASSGLRGGPMRGIG
jgi:hypothetical protein